MPEETIKVTIINDSKSVQCDAGCGTDWSTPEALDLAQQRIKARFNGKIELEYIDLSQSPDNPVAQEWIPVIKEKKLFLPLLLVSRHLRITGQFDIRQLMDVIEVATETDIVMGD